jgi:hypothetical protein
MEPALVQSVWLIEPRSWHLFFSGGRSGEGCITGNLCWVDARVYDFAIHFLPSAANLES